MASSGNFAVFNPLANTQAGLSYSDAVYSQGNARFRGNTGGTATTQLTHALSSGKWYIEFYIDGSPAGGFPMIGIVASGADSNTLQNTSNAAALTITSDLQTVNGDKRVFGSTSGTSYGSGFSDEDICQMAIDIDNGKVWWGKNNTWFASGNPASGTNAGDTFTGGTEMMVFVGSYNGAAYTIVNAGQDDTFGGRETASGNTDANSRGVFKYAPPTGFLSVASSNLPISDDIDPAQTDDDYPSKQFNAVLYTGNGSSNAISGLGFKPDLVWGKSRSASQSHRLYDSSRGGSSMLFSDTNAAAQTGSTFMTSFDSDGFTYSSSGSNANDNTVTYVAWCWRANGGTTASNSEGNITSTVQANTKAGFSIITYTGSGGTVSGANPTFGHGLESAPDFLIFKCRSNGSTNWIVWHSGLGGASKYVSLNATSAVATDTAWLSNTAPSSTLITTDNGGWGAVNGSSRTYVCYAWHNVAGMQKFGSYEGNGNADGPFIYTGFRPRLFVQKRIDSTGSWRVWDASRHPYNPNDAILRWEDSGAEDTANASVSFLSNGFKIRITYTEVNADGGDYVYMCWGDVPFKYNNTF